eukprot:7918608-Pyramimonas_sp.AAC.1
MGARTAAGILVGKPFPLPLPPRRPTRVHIPLGRMTLGFMNREARIKPLEDSSPQMGPRARRIECESWRGAAIHRALAIYVKLNGL